MSNKQKLEAVLGIIRTEVNPLKIYLIGYEHEREAASCFTGTIKAIPKKPIRAANLLILVPGDRCLYYAYTIAKACNDTVPIRSMVMSFATFKLMHLERRTFATEIVTKALELVSERELKIGSYNRYYHEHWLSERKEIYLHYYYRGLEFRAGAEFYFGIKRYPLTVLLLQQTLEFFFRSAAAIQFDLTTIGVCDLRLLMHVSTLNSLDMANIFTADTKKWPAYYKTLDSCFVPARYEPGYHVEEMAVLRLISTVDGVKEIVAKYVKVGQFRKAVKTL